MQFSVMPMAIAASGTGMAGMAAGSGPDKCDGCGQQDMTAAQCVAGCVSAFIVVGYLPAETHIFNVQPWTWLPATLRNPSVEPDLSPPRS
ncbi:MAG: hypothetical protein ACREE7_17880, partial [Dongiaceae bacterium]